MSIHNRFKEQLQEIERLFEESESASSSSTVSTLKLRPKFARPDFAPEPEPEILHALKLKELEHKNRLKKKKADRLKKQMQIYQRFILHLMNNGKNHLVPDCILERGTGVIQFLSLEVMLEFVKFMPGIKLKLRANTRDQAFKVLRDVHRHGVSQAVRELQIGDDIVNGLRLSEFMNRATPTPRPVPF